MKTHTQKEHNVDDEPKSAARKLAKTMNKDDNEKPEDQTMDSVKPSNKKQEDLEQTLTAAIQTIESLEEQNCELHMKIDHLGEMALVVGDLESEN